MKNRMMKKAASAIVLSTLVNIATPAWAEEPSDTKEYDLPRVVVMGQEIAEETPVYSRLAIPESSKAATETFTREDIEAMHPKDVLEVLERGAGFIGTRWGAKGYYNIQGRGGDSIGIVIDGIYFPET
ncbi:MAG: TonB-dependent receptor plug domain-containing protein, partial [Sporomusa sp.]